MEKHEKKLFELIILKNLRKVFFDVKDFILKQEHLILNDAKNLVDYLNLDYKAIEHDFNKILSGKKIKEPTLNFIKEQLELKVEKYLNYLELKVNEYLAFLNYLTYALINYNKIYTNVLINMLNYIASYKEKLNNYTYENKQDYNPEFDKLMGIKGE